MLRLLCSVTFAVIHGNRLFFILFWETGDWRLEMRFGVVTAAAATLLLFFHVVFHQTHQRIKRVHEHVYFVHIIPGFKQTQVIKA